MATTSLTYTVYVPTRQELQMNVDNTAKQYGEAALISEFAWKMYSVAIDDNDPDREILGQLADKKQLEMTAAYEAWQEAKRLLLSMWN